MGSKNKKQGSSHGGSHGLEGVQGGWTKKRGGAEERGGTEERGGRQDREI